MAKIIRITISPKGETKITSLGFTGTECLNATKPFEEGLAGKRDTPGPELYAAGSEGQAISIGNG